MAGEQAGGEGAGNGDQNGGAGAGGDQKNGAGAGAGAGNGGDEGEGGGDKRVVPYEALSEERAKRKAAQAEADEAKQKLSKIEADAQEAERKKLEEQGEHLKLYEEERKKNEGLELAKKSLEEELTLIKNSSEARIKTQIEAIESPEDKELVTQMLEGKNLSEKEDLLPKIIAKFTGRSTNANPPVGSGGGRAEDDEVERKKAAEQNNPMNAIKYAPVIK